MRPSPFSATLRSGRLFRAVLLCFLCCLLLPLRADAARREAPHAQLVVPLAYPTIQAAVDAASDGDTVLVLPGVYRESVDLVGKRLSLVGTDRDTCVIEYPSADYDYSPLKVSGGEVKNLTVHALMPANEEIVAFNEARDEREKERRAWFSLLQLDGLISAFGEAYPIDAFVMDYYGISLPREKFFGAYCLHIDYPELENSRVYVENVRFVNDAFTAVGIGLRRNADVEFVACEFEAHGANADAIFVHDWETSEHGLKNQRFTLINSILVNDAADGATLTLQSQETEEGVATATLIGNSVVNLSGGNAIDMKLWSFRAANLSHGAYLGSSDWFLSPSSRENNVPLMNHPTREEIETPATEPIPSGVSDGK